MATEQQRDSVVRAAGESGIISSKMISQILVLLAKGKETPAIKALLTESERARKELNRVLDERFPDR